jgi:N-acetylglucosamine kinase-like BadF-type ATPase
MNSTASANASTALYLGVDGGGTQTRAWLADASGTVLGQGQGGVANINYASKDAVRATIRDACSKAFTAANIQPQVVRSAWLGLAGMGRRADRQWMQGDLSDLAGKVTVGDDLHIAHCGGFAGAPGITLVAGTGSACYGLNAAGQHWRCGGWGALADDVGSASWLSQRAIQIAVRQADGRIEGDELQTLVFSFLKIECPEDLPQAVDRLSRDQRARLSQELSPLCAKGNVLTEALYAEAADALTEMIAATARRLEMPNPQVILSGAMACRGGPLYDRIAAELRQALPTAQLVEPHYSACAGALIEALRMDHVCLHEALLKNLAK